MRTFIFCLQLSGIGANPPFVIPRPTALTAAADLPMMGSAQDPGIQRFGKSDASRVNQCLQVIKKAFQDDALFIFLNKDRDDYVGPSSVDYAKSSAIKAAHDGTFFATTDMSSVVLCYHIPEQMPIEPDEQQAPVFPDMEEAFHEWEGKFYKAHGPFLYFGIVATLPSMQGKGLAGKLLKAATEVADEQGKWCWVEASSPGSSKLYAKHGFKTVHECVLQPGCPSLFFMKRAPAVP